MISLPFQKPHDLPADQAAALNRLLRGLPAPKHAAAKSKFVRDYRKAMVAPVLGRNRTLPSC